MVHSANNKPLQPLTDFIDLPESEHYYVAYSGGMDSTALLHTLRHNDKFNNKLTAIHVNHSINVDSNQWAKHCHQVCQSLNIPIITESQKPIDSSENACRSVRQEVFKHHLKQDNCLLTAHHLNDHIETVLFRLFRGTGLQGMTGMAKTNAFEHYTIHRPLLSLSQANIEQYVRSHQLPYIDDPSNADNHYNRNHIRNLIMPELIKYDAKVIQSIDATSNNLKQSQLLLQQLIGQDNPFKFKKYAEAEQLSTALYHWLHNLALKAPHQKKLMQFSKDCLNAAKDKNPELEPDAYRLIRWQNNIYALQIENPLNQNHLLIELNSTDPVIALPNNGTLSFTAKQPVNLPAVIKYQQRHEVIQIHQNGPHKKLKQLFQQLNIPPWERNGLPYLYINNQLMAVGSKIISTEFQQILSQYNAEYRWLSPTYVL